MPFVMLIDHGGGGGGGDGGNASACVRSVRQRRLHSVYDIQIRAHIHLYGIVTRSRTLARTRSPRALIAISACNLCGARFGCATHASQQPHPKCGHNQRHIMRGGGGDKQASARRFVCAFHHTRSHALPRSHIGAAAARVDSRDASRTTRDDAARSRAGVPADSGEHYSVQHFVLSVQHILAVFRVVFCPAVQPLRVSVAGHNVRIFARAPSGGLGAGTAQGGGPSHGGPVRTAGHRTGQVGRR